ncbi:MAG: choloylglycine hydrolase family protein [Candidatus Omnitrophica bacterium]|nr:choloylglycine hydrolase family protein [Candidatus Omnitrophota bacterium]
MKIFKFLVSVVVVSIFCQSNAMACSSFKVVAKDGTIVNTRTMEFGYDTASAVVVIPRGKDFTSPSPDNNIAGLKWNNKYGYVGVNVFGKDDLIVDGLNEAGLSFSALWYEPDIKWQEVAPGEEAKALAYEMLGAWALGNFSKVEEVRAAINDIKIYAMVMPAMKMAPPMHIALYDSAGGSIVIECDKGEVHVYDNPIGVMTNAPNFPWMITNLRSYIGLSEKELPAAEYAGIKLNPTGHGNGMLGLPGDITPPSRFVRMAVMLHFADQQDDADGALNLAQHVANSFTIVKGMAVDRTPDGKTVSNESTQWTALKDLTNKVFYFQTYDNLDMRKIDLKQLDFKTEKTISMSGDKGTVVDKTPVSEL